MQVKSVQYPYELDNELKNYKSTLVMFTATWCGPCKIIKPIFQRFSVDSKYENIGFIQVDIDEADELCREYNIKSVPTFIMFVDGTVYERLQGASSSSLQKLLDERL